MSPLIITAKMKARFTNNAPSYKHIYFILLWGETCKKEMTERFVP